MLNGANCLVNDHNHIVSLTKINAHSIRGASEGASLVGVAVVVAVGEANYEGLMLLDCR